MSHVVHLWQQPVPATVAQAETTLRELRQQMRFEADPAVAILLAAIHEDLAGQGDPEDLWTELPEPDGSDCVLSLTPTTAALTTVLPAIERAARRFGWVVFDPLGGEVRLPSGRVLGGPDDGADAPPPPPRDLDSSARVRERWLREQLAPLFTRHGWHPLPGEFSFGKEFPCAHVRVFQEAERETTLRFGVWIAPILPPRLHGALDSDGGPKLVLSLEHLAKRHRATFTHDGQPARWEARVGDPTYGLPFDSADAAVRRRDELSAFCEGVLFGWLDTLGSLSDLDHWANRVPDADCPFIGLRQRGTRFIRLLNHHPDLLLAAAVDAPDFERQARDRIALYEADGFGRTLVPELRRLLAVCGLHI